MGIFSASWFWMKENPFEIVPSKAKLTALKTTGVDKKGDKVAEEKLFWISIGWSPPRFCRHFAALPAKLNSHKNLCKPVNLDQIGFDLSDNEISAPDRRFVIDSVLGRGHPRSGGRIWSENNGLGDPKHGQLQIWQIRSPCISWTYPEHGLNAI